jgi:DNA-binding IclR family transcriptional regulator
MLRTGPRAHVGGEPRRRTSSSASGLVPSVERALAILDLVGRSRENLTLSAMGHHLRIPLSSLHGLVSTLLHLGYLEREEPSKVYRLGPKVGELGSSYHTGVDLAAVARSAMDRVRDAAGETVSLTILEGNQIVFVDKRPGQGQVQVVNPVGTRQPAHATGAGKVMLAYLPEAEFDRLYPDERLPALTPSTIASRRKLKQAGRQIRERGYAFDNQESELGVWAVAACIRDARGFPVGALNIVAPLFRVRNRDCTDWRLLVMRAAVDVSEALGFSNAPRDEEVNTRSPGGHTHGSPNTERDHRGSGRPPGRGGGLSPAPRAV